MQSGILDSKVVTVDVRAGPFVVCPEIPPIRRRIGGAREGSRSISRQPKKKSPPVSMPLSEESDGADSMSPERVFVADVRSGGRVAAPVREAFALKKVCSEADGIILKRALTIDKEELKQQKAPLNSSEKKRCFTTTEDEALREQPEGEDDYITEKMSEHLLASSGKVMSGEGANGRVCSEEEETPRFTRTIARSPNQ